MHARVIFLLIGILTGLICGEILHFSTSIAITACVIACIQFGLHTITKKKYQNGISFFITIPLALGLFFLGISIGIIRTQFIVQKNNFICNEVCTFQATVVSFPEKKNDYQVFSVTQEDAPGTLDVLVKTSLYPEYRVGDKIILTGKVLMPKQNFPHENSPSFNYVQYLNLHDIGSEIIYPKIEKNITQNEDRGIVVFLKNIKIKSVDILSNYIGSEEVTLVSGMLLGSSSMSQELTQTFRVSGLSHIVVLSGFNITILISVIISLLRYTPFVLRIALSFFAMIMFVVMTGSEVSVVRAMLMSALALVALLFGRGYRAEQALLISLLCIVVYQPLHFLYDVSLCLSFLATAGIIYTSKIISEKLHWVSSENYKETIAITFSAYVMTLPYIMYTFGTVSLYALFANIIALPLVPVTMFSGALVLLISFVSSPLATSFGYLVTMLSALIIFIARHIQMLPLASVTLTISFKEMCFMYLFVVLFYLSLQRVRKNETLLTKEDEIISGVISY